MAGSGYCYYIIAKALNTAEGQEPVGFSDFWDTFLGLIFYPLGLWFIQPRINALFDPEEGLERIEKLV
jgi:hypothetical protein